MRPRRKDVTRIEEEHREAARIAEIEKFIAAAGGDWDSGFGAVACYLNGVSV